MKIIIKDSLEGRGYKKGEKLSFVCTIRYGRETFPGLQKLLKDKTVPMKAILLINNTPPRSGDTELVKGEIRVKFLHPNITPLIQPLDQGVLENLKHVYRKQL